MEDGRVLIIDDDAGLRKTLSDILRAKGYEAAAARDGIEGLDLLKQGQFDVVLIDLMLPGMPGIEVLARAKSDRPFTEAIILTGNASLDSAIDATNKGAFSYLQKPYEIDQLTLHIRRAMEKQDIGRALRESEAKFRELTEKSLAGIYLIQDEVFRYVNPTMAKIFGYTVEELTGGMGPDDLTMPEDRPKVRENIRRRIAGEVDSIHYEFRGLRKTGETAFIEVFGTGIDYMGRPAVFGTLLDITEKRKAEEEQKRLVAGLQEALARVRTLSGLLPICAYCKKVRSDEGYWKQIEEYISEHSDAVFSHGSCPECAQKAYEEFIDMKKSRKHAER